MPERTYSEEEVAALLERAAELHLKSADHADHKAGLTLRELEAIASEAGIDPALLRQAAQELEKPSRTLLDAPANTSATHLYEERWVPGTLTTDEWEDIVAELRHRYDTDMGTAMGMPGYGVGKIEQIGRTLEWRHTSMSGVETRVMIRQRGEGMRIRLSRRVGWASSMTESITLGTIAAGLAALIAGAVSKSLGLGLGVLFVVLISCIPLIYLLDQKWRAKKHRDLAELADRIAHLATADDATSSSEQSLAASTPHPPLLDDSPEIQEALPGEPTPSRRRVR